MKASIDASKKLVTVGDIAKLAGVKSPAVSNWRKRHTDFPSSVKSGAAAELFDRAEVLAWMQRHNRAFVAPAPSVVDALWAISESLRGVVPMEDSALLTLQLIYLHQRAFSTVAGDPELSRFWASSDGATARTTWEHFAERCSTEDADLGRALALPRGVDEAHLWRALRLLLDAQAEQVEWGPVASALLRQYEDAVGMRGSFFATPQSVTDLALALLEPIHGTVYDPACGLGMVLAEAWKLRTAENTTLVGQEVSERSWRLGYLHLRINHATFSLASGDTLKSDQFRNLRATRVFIDPPLLGRTDVGDLLGDERWAFGVPQSSTDWLWAQQALFHLHEEGTGVAVMPLTSLFRAGRDANVRRGIVESDMLDAVIELPPGLWAGSGATAAMLVFARLRPGREGRVLFIDGRQLGKARRGQNRQLHDADTERVLAVVDAWRAGHMRPEAMFSAVGDFDAIRAKEYDLSPSRYVGYKARRVTGIDSEPLGSRFERLRTRVAAALPSPFTRGVHETVSQYASGADATSPGMLSDRLDIIEALAMVRDGAQAFEPRNAAAWPAVRMGDLMTEAPIAGMRQEEDKQGPEIPYIPTRHISGGAGHLNALPDEVTRGTVRGRLAKRGDLLLVCRGIDSEGKIGCATVCFDGEAAFSESLMRLRLDATRVDPDFVRLYLTSRSGRATLVAVTTGSVIANLRGVALEEVVIPLPPLHVQRSISAAMTQVEAGIVHLVGILRDASDLFDTTREAMAAGSYAPKSERQP